MSEPRDPAVDAILTAETLIEQFSRALADLGAVGTRRDLAIEQTLTLYPEIWTNLDVARRTLAGRGVATAAYDEVRALQPQALLGATKIETQAPSAVQIAAIAALSGVAGLARVVTGQDQVRVVTGNRAGRDDARRAVGLLRDAMPAVAWDAERSHGERAAASLAMASVRRRWVRLGFAVATLALLLGGVYVAATGMKKEPAAEAPTGVDEATRLRQIEGLKARLAKKPCEVVSGELMVKQLILVNRVDDAAAFGADFIARCGDNSFIRNQLEGHGHPLPPPPLPRSP